MKTRLFRVVVLLAAMAAAALLSASSKAAEQEVLFDDAFSTLDATLGVESESLWVKDNALFRKLDANFQWSGLYVGMIFEDADMSLKTRFPTADAGKPLGTTVGMVFWARDYSDFYTLEVTDEGYYRVGHYTQGRWLFPVTVRKCAPLHREPRAWNELRVVTVGRQATMFVNGEELMTIQGQPPAGGGMMGPYFETFTAGGTAEFTGLKITQPTETASPAPAQDPQILFADNFASLDPAWGEASESKGVRNGAFFYQLAADENWRQLYEARLFSDCDLRVKARLIGGSDTSSANLMFWAKSYDDFYMLTLYNDGQVAVYRWVKDRWLTPLAPRTSAEAKINPKDWTELRVVTEGRKAHLMVNGVEIGVISGQPPQGGSKIGLRGQASEAACGIEFSSLEVRKPLAAAE